MGRREIYAAQTKAAVLEAAKALFVADGFAATSVEDIARASQSSKGAVYHHFSDKQEIFVEVFRAGQEKIMHSAVATLGGEGTPWGRIEAATKAFLHAYAADSDARSLLRQAMGVLGWDRTRDIDESTALPLIRAALQEFIRIGEAPPIPVDITAELLFSLFCNAVLIVVASPDPKSAGDDAERVILAMLRGLKHSG